jgi:hypothetical protein
LSPRKLLREKNCSRNLLTMSKFIVSKNLLNKFAHGELNFLTENQFCSRRIMNCTSFYLQSSMDAWHDFYLHKLLKAKKICSQTVKKNCSQKSNLLKKFAHRICSQRRKTAHDEKPCWFGWINTKAKCLASSQQSEHGWRAPLNGLSCNSWNVLGRTFLEYHLYVVVTLVKVNCTWGMGKYTTTRGVHVIDMVQRAARDFAKTSFSTRRSQRNLWLLRNLAEFLVAKPSYAARSRLLVITTGVHCTLYTVHCTLYTVIRELAMTYWCSIYCN